MTDFIWGFILGLLVSSFSECLMLALAYVSASADEDDLADGRRLSTKDDWVWIG